MARSVVVMLSLGNIPNMLLRVLRTGLVARKFKGEDSLANLLEISFQSLKAYKDPPVRLLRPPDIVGLYFFS